MTYYIDDKDRSLRPQRPTRRRRVDFARTRKLDITFPFYIQIWIATAAKAFCVAIQVGVGPIILLYDPSHSAARHIPQVGLMWYLNHAFTDMIVTSHPWATCSNTRLHQGPVARSIHASMPYLYFRSRSLLWVASKRPVSTSIPALRNWSCYRHVLRLHP